MRYKDFVNAVRQNEWSVSKLRCDVPPSDELLHFIDEVGVNYESFVLRYSTMFTTVISLEGLR